MAGIRKSADLGTKGVRNIADDAVFPSTVAVTSITGTANQVTVSASTGAVTVSLPQSIHTGATPTFAGLTSTANVNYTASNLVWLGGGVWDEDANWSGVGGSSGNRILMKHTTDGAMYIISRASTVKIRSTTGGSDYIFSNTSLDTSNRPISVGTGYIQAGATGVTDAGSVSATNWFRSTGGSGWYNNTYGGGVYMDDTTYVKIYGSKTLYSSYGYAGAVQYGSYGSTTLYGTTGGYAGWACPTNSSTFMWTNNICGHYYNNSTWNWYFDRGVLYLSGDSNTSLTWNNNNSGLPWHYGPTLVGYNGWSYYDNRSASFKCGYRNYDGTNSYFWSGGFCLVGSTPNDTLGGYATLFVNGSAAKTTGGTSWVVYSDARVKRNVQDYSRGLSDILQLRPVSFEYNGAFNSEEGHKSVGLIAQEAEQVFPEIVELKEADDGETIINDFRTLNFNDVQFAMINAIKEMSATIDSLTARILELENK